MIHVSENARPDCYATQWSYGQICCHSNCCGQFGKGLKMWEARLNYHQELLERSKNFTDWIKGFEKAQRKNLKSDIKFQKLQIKKCKERIKHFKNKETKK